MMNMDVYFRLENITSLKRFIYDATSGLKTGYMVLWRYATFDTIQRNDVSAHHLHVTVEPHFYGHNTSTSFPKIRSHSPSHGQPNSYPKVAVKLRFYCGHVYTV